MMDMIKDIKSMIKKFAEEAPIILEHPLIQEDVDFLEGLFEKHITEHIEKIGGIDNLKLMTHEELYKRWDNGVTDLFDG